MILHSLYSCAPYSRIANRPSFHHVQRALSRASSGSPLRVILIIRRKNDKNSPRQLKPYKKHPAAIRDQVFSELQDPYSLRLTGQFCGKYSVSAGFNDIVRLEQNQLITVTNNQAVFIAAWAFRNPLRSLHRPRRGIRVAFVYP